MIQPPAMRGHGERKIEHKLDEVVRHLDHIAKRISEMSKSLDDLTVEVSHNRDVVASAVALINGFSKRLDDAIAAAKAGDDSAALDALSADLKTQADQLGNAVAANTPAAPSTTPTT